jgi:ElaB/YqjD/DUF883 family membrane-anchored ribosome-binding protein
MSRQTTEHSTNGVVDFSWLPEDLRRLAPSPEELIARQKNEAEEQLSGARERLTASYRRVRQLEEAVRNWDWFADRLPGRAHSDC